jgi:hypothetical protein
MRDATPVTLLSPPEYGNLLMPGCSRDTLATGCPWPVIEQELRQAVDPHATTVHTLSPEGP